MPWEPDKSSAQSDLCCSLELNHAMLVSSGQRRTEPGFSKVFSPFLSPMEFWFLATVAFGLLSWGRLTDCTDTIGRELNWLMTSLNHQWTDFEWMNELAGKKWLFVIVLLHYWHNQYCIKLYINRGKKRLDLVEHAGEALCWMGLVMMKNRMWRTGLEAMKNLSWVRSATTKNLSRAGLVMTNINLYRRKVCGWAGWEALTPVDQQFLSIQLHQYSHWLGCCSWLTPQVRCKGLRLLCDGRLFCFSWWRQLHRGMSWHSICWGLRLSQIPPFHQQEPGASSEPVLLPVLSWFDWRAL